MPNRYRKPCEGCGVLLPEFSVRHRCQPCAEAAVVEARQRRATIRRITTDQRRAAEARRGPNARMPDVGERTAAAMLDSDKQLRAMRARVARYKITLGQWGALVQRQGSSCAICSKHMPAAALHIDHDHETGRVRGLLCTRCNTGLGALGIDGPAAHERASSVIRYLTGEAKRSGPLDDTRFNLRRSGNGTPLGT